MALSFATLCPLATLATLATLCACYSVCLAHFAARDPPRRHSLPSPVRSHHSLSLSCFVSLPLLFSQDAQKRRFLDMSEKEAGTERTLLREGMSHWRGNIITYRMGQ